MAEDISGNLLVVKGQVAAALQRSGRSADSVTIIAVTKFADIPAIQQIINSGILDLGENKVQSALEKVHTFVHSPIVWHFIGHLQTNKVRDVVRYFHMIHSVDSLKLAKVIDTECEKQQKSIDVLCEVNISGEASKFGFTVEELQRVLPELCTLKHIAVKGLMTMAPLCADPEASRPVFRSLRRLRDDLEKSSSLHMKLPCLSMGMSNDYEIAIEEGATYVRIGTALFGIK